MNVAVAVIWRPTAAREQAFRFVCEQYRRILPGAPIIASDAGGDGFNRSASRNLAMRMCAGFDVVVLSDADCVHATPGSGLHPAIADASDGRLHMPYTEQHYCTEAETNRIYAGDLAPIPGGEGAGACYVVTPDSYWRAGGSDERTGVVWGADDDVLYCAAHALTGVVRHAGTVLSLWHADEHRPVGQPEWLPNSMLARRYHEARDDPQAMRNLIAERG